MKICLLHLVIRGNMHSQKNNILLVAVSLFSASFFSVNNIFAKEDKVEVVENKKTISDALKETLDISGNVKGVFSYSGLPGSNIKNAANDFRPMSLRLGQQIPPSFDAGVKASLSLGKTFKNEYNRNVLKVNVTLGMDKFNENLNNGRVLEIESAKGIFYDCLKVGFDQEFVTGAKGMLIGGMWKFNNFFTLNADIIRDLDLSDLKSGSLLGTDEKDPKFLYSNSIPTVGVQGQFNLGNLGFVKVGGIVRPVLLLSGKDQKTFLTGFGLGTSGVLHFVKNVDTLVFNFLFGSGIGEFNNKVKVGGVALKNVNSGISNMPVSFFFSNSDNSSNDYSSNIHNSNFFNGFINYAYKIMPQHELSVGMGDLFYLGSDAFDKFIGDKDYCKNLFNCSLGYKYSACKKMDLSVVGNAVHIKNAKKALEKVGNWGWNMMFAADFKF